EAFAELRPDVVVRDLFEYGSAIVAGERGVPTARIATCMAFVEGLCLGWAGPELEPVSEGIVDRIRATPWLTVVPESLEDSKPPAPGSRWTGRRRWATTWPAPWGDWSTSRRSARRRRGSRARPPHWRRSTRRCRCLIWSRATSRRRAHARLRSAARWRAGVPD